MVVKSNSGMIRPYHAWIKGFQRIVDVGIVMSILPAMCLVYNVNFIQPYQVFSILGGAFMWISLNAMHAYRAWRGTPFWAEAKVLLASWAWASMGLIVIAWFMNYTSQIAFYIFVSWLVIVPIFLVTLHALQRWFLYSIRKQGKNSRKVIIVGAGQLGMKLGERIQQDKSMGMHLVGFFDDNTQKDIGDAHMLGDIDSVCAYVKAQNIDIVYFTLPMLAEDRLRGLFDELQDTTASLFFVPDMFIFELFNATEHEVAGMPTFALCETPLTGASGFIKRAEDIFLSTFFLLAIWPLLLAIAVAIRASSSGPVIFKQYRYGLNGQRIKIFKFRSMTVCDDDETFIQQASKYDIRVTALGAFLRRTSLDELPQLINVLLGDMSIVGPRPHAVAHNEEYRKLIKGYMWRHKVKPGITGWAQINGWRGETDTLSKMEKRVEYDLDYIRRWTIMFDIKIVVLTIVKGFVGKNTY